MVQLFFQLNTVGPDGYPVETKGLKPRVCPWYLENLLIKYPTLVIGVYFPGLVFKYSKLQCWLSQQKKVKVP